VLWLCRATGSRGCRREHRVSDVGVGNVGISRDYGRRVGVEGSGRVAVGALMGDEVWQESRWSERCERLAGALAGLSRDLADARREIVVLKRENAALRGRLAHAESSGPAGDAPGDGRGGLRGGLW